MKRTRAGKRAGRPHTFVARTPSGVKGLDEITLGGLPKGRPTLIKYGGSTHGTNEYPFLIDATGISVMPITSLGLNADASTGRISSGIPRKGA